MIRAISLGVLLALWALPSPSSAGMAAEASPLVADNRTTEPQNEAVFGVVRFGETLNGAVVYFASVLPPGPKEGTVLLANANGSKNTYPVVVGARQKTIPANAPTINGQAPAAAYSLMSQSAMMVLPPAEWAFQVAVVQVPALPVGLATSPTSTGGTAGIRALPAYRLCSKAGLSILSLQSSPPWEAALPATSAEAALKPCP